jgi:hypothetical protein
VLRGVNCRIEGREVAGVGAPAVVLCGAELSNQSGLPSVFEANPDWFAPEDDRERPRPGTLPSLDEAVCAEDRRQRRRQTATRTP